MSGEGYSMEAKSDAKGAKAHMELDDIGEWEALDEGTWKKLTAEEIATALNDAHGADGWKHSLHSWFNYALRLCVDGDKATLPKTEAAWQDLYAKGTALSLLLTLLPPSLEVETDDDGFLKGEYALPFDARDFDREGDKIGKWNGGARYEKSGGYSALLDIPWEYVCSEKTQANLIRLFEEYAGMSIAEGEVAEEIIPAIRRRELYVIPPLPIVLPFADEALVKEVDAYYEHHSKQHFWEAEGRLRKDMDGVPLGLMSFELRDFVFGLCIKDALASQNWEGEEEGRDLAERWFYAQMRQVVYPEDDCPLNILSPGESIAWRRFTDSEKRRIIPAMSRIMARMGENGLEEADYEEELRAAADMKQCRLCAK